MSEIQLFDDGEFELRITPVGDSFIVEAPSLAHDLGSRDARSLLRTVPDEEKVYAPVRTPSGEQEIWHVTEPGFYRVMGQRQAGRIKNATVRDKVVRFQNWVFRDVLPAIRRTGSYSVEQQPKPVGGDDPFKPDAYTWKETCTIIRQEYRIRVGVVDLRRTLMAAGVLNQQFEPKADFADCFWWTGTAYLVYRHCVPAIFFHYRETKRKMRAFGPDSKALPSNRQGDLFAIEGGASS